MTNMTNERRAVARKLLDLKIKSLAIDSEINRCRNFLAETAPEGRNQMRLGGGSTVSTYPGKYTFAVEHRTEGFKNIASDKIRTLIDDGVIVEKENIILNQVTMNTLSSEKINELVSDSILVRKTDLSGNEQALAELDHNHRAELVREGIVRKPSPLVRVKIGKGPQAPELAIAI